MQNERDVIPTWTYGDRLRKARETAHLDAMAMAEKLAVKPASISQWERGRVKPRDMIDISRRWAEITGVSIEWLLGLDSELKSRCTSAEGILNATVPARRERRRLLERRSRPPLEIYATAA